MNQSNAATIGALIGAPIGMLLAYYGFTHIAWYHDITVWAWNTPWMYVLGAIGGIALCVWDESNNK